MINNYNNITPDIILEFIAKSKTFNFSVYDGEITQINKLIDFINHNLEPCINYDVIFSYNYKRYTVNSLFIGKIQFIINNIYDCEKITDFHSEITTFLNSAVEIDTLKYIKVIQVSFFNPEKK